MKFKESKSIYLQIADRISDEILVGRYAEEERIPSVREYASLVEVNANTAMRSYDFLQSQDVIYIKRGIGYFVSLGAKKRIRDFRRESFMQHNLSEFFNQVYTLGLSMDDLVLKYKEYVREKEKGVSE